ncbi:MAG: DNA polymerase I [Patescibacteria group bacterium]
MTNKHKKFIIIDANALLHRSFHALPPLTTKDGRLINAVYGFTSVLLKVLKEFKATYVAVAYDMRGKTFRHEDFAQYKAGRPKAPQAFYDQIPMSKDVLSVLGIPVFEKQGFEADDVIGTVAALNKKKDIETVIVTGDKDAFQLIDDHTVVYTLRKGMSDTVIYDEKALDERYGLTPAQMIEYKALAGDPSDNIPGVKGIGDKSALELLKKFNTVENIYKEIDAKGDVSDIKPRYLKLLREHKKEAFMSRELATIVRDVPLEYSNDRCRLHPLDKGKVFALFQELGFKSLLGRLPDIKPERGEEEGVKEGEDGQNIEKAEKPNSKSSREVSYQLVQTDSEFADFLAEAREQTVMAVDTESTSLDPFRAKLLGVSFCWEDGHAFYLDIKNNRIWLEKLKPLLEDEKISKFGHNIKYDLAILAQAGIVMAPASFDSMVASYLLNPGSRGHGLDALAFEIFGYQMQPITDLIGKGKDAITMDLVPTDKVSWYSCEDADFTYRLCRYFRPELEEKRLLSLMRDIEMPLVPVLAMLEKNGVKIDVPFLAALSGELGQKISTLEKKIYELSGTTFNINSPLQLKEVLFGRLKISTEGISKTKTGLSTAAAQLEKMRDQHPIIALLTEYRELSKLQSTYVEALPKLVNPKTGRIHTSFNQTITATGRLSSSDPNFQNIPIRTEEGRKIRQAIIAEKGFKIVSADYSQIELRVVASLAHDEKMIESFKKGEDIHRRTAADIYNIPLEEVTDEQRYEAKEVNFGVLYGMGAWGLASRKNMSRERARAFIEKYFYVHQQIQEYLGQTIESARELEYVETLFGRRRYLPEINSEMRQVRAQAERMAVNMPVQGTAADLMKMAMITIAKKLPGVSPRTRMILQVHDELVFEVPAADVEKVGAFIRQEMNSVYTMDVPLKTDVSVGPNWGEQKKK